MATATQMGKAVDLAEAENGYGETPVNLTKFGKWYGLDGNAWCAMFVSWAYYTAGAPQPASSSKGFAYTPSGAAWYQSKQAWAGPTTNPQRGWVVFFYSNSAGRIAHVGLVRGPRGSDGYVPTVEGNTNGAGSAEGGAVLLKRRSPSQSLSFRIAGYGIPGDATTAAEEWFAMPIGTNELDQIKGAVRQVLSISPGGDLENVFGTVNNDKILSILLDNIRATKAQVQQNLSTFLAMAEAGFNVDLTAVQAGIITAVGEAATDALADVDVGLSDADAERLADAFARRAGERLIGQVPPPA